jgi:hypothetical protein
LPLAENARFTVVDSLLVRVEVFAALVFPTISVPKERAAGFRVSGRFPVPESETVCGESGALSMIAREPLSGPATVGVKLMLTVQEAPAARLDPQVLLATAKFPVTAIEVMLTEIALVFLNVTALVALVVLTA